MNTYEVTKIGNKEYAVINTLTQEIQSSGWVCYSQAVTVCNDLNRKTKHYLAPTKRKKIKAALPANIMQ